MGQVYLRALDLGDLETIYTWHNDPSLYQSLGGVFHYVSHASIEEWLRKKQSFSAQEVNLAICLKPDTRHIGNIYLRDIDWPARHGELHIFIGDSSQRTKGYGEAAIRLLINHAFQDLGLMRLYLFVLAYNKPAVHVYEKCGFIVEGTLRKHAFKDGKFEDVVLMGTCRSEETMAR